MGAHELAHVEAHHRFLVIEEGVGERLGQLGLADAGGAEEEEGGQGPARVGQPGARSHDGLGHRIDGTCLPLDARRQDGGQV